MPAMNPNYNPAQVMMRNPNAGSFGGGASGPYLGGGEQSGARNVGQESFGPNRIAKTGLPTPKPAPPSNILQSETVRATGGGPFDSAYRQNLATYAGGQMARPGGNLSFNPTSATPFGNPTGGGTDPITGGPNSLTAMALGGEGFSYTAPKPPVPKKNSSMQPDWQDWLSSRSRYGRGM
jgi:hypothetical protein